MEKPPKIVYLGRKENSSAQISINESDQRISLVEDHWNCIESHKSENGDITDIYYRLLSSRTLEEKVLLHNRSSVLSHKLVKWGIIEGGTDYYTKLSKVFRVSSKMGYFRLYSLHYLMKSRTQDDIIDNLLLIKKRTKKVLKNTLSAHN